MAYVVLETDPFSKLFQTLSKEEQDWIRKMIGQLKDRAAYRQLVEGL